MSRSAYSKYAMKNTQPSKNKAHVISVDMGYGHERAAYALRELTSNDIITANNYQGIPKADKKLWSEGQQFYETVSRLKMVPFIGNYIFEAYDKFQEIPAFYPRRDLSRPNLQVRQINHLISKRGWGRDLIDRLRKNPLPLVTTFFVPAYMAEVFGYPGKIYCVICDADISRTWVSVNPKSSPIIYLASNGRTVERLKLYGVPAENIKLTGFPLPPELVGGPHSAALKTDLARRLLALDPNGIFRSKYDRALHQELGAHWHGKHARRTPFTITYCVGGAGAQFELGIQILESLKVKLAEGHCKLNLVAGTHKSVEREFKKAVRKLRLTAQLGHTVNILAWPTRQEYFKGFSRALKKTDILWTKPSELSFYTGLGIPIIIAPPIGSQEDFNATWLRTVGGGVPQNDPRYTNEWLFDWWESGGLAKMAWSGYMEAPTHGAYRIQELITGEKFRLQNLPLIV